MRRYTVVLQEVVVYRVPVDADSPEEAMERAERIYTQTPVDTFFSHVEERQVVGVEDTPL